MKRVLSCRRNWKCRSAVRSPESDSECGRVMNLGRDRNSSPRCKTNITDRPQPKKNAPDASRAPRRTGKLGGFLRRLPLSLCITSRPCAGTRRRAGAGDVSRGLYAAGGGCSQDGRVSRTWLVGILKHRIVDHLRRTNAERAKRRRNPRHDQSTTAAFDGADTGVPCRPPGEATRVLCPRSAREFWDRFRRLPLSRLPR